MSKEFDKLMSAHEESDRYYIDDINEVRARVKEEFENADKFLSYLQIDYWLTDFSFQNFLLSFVINGNYIKLHKKMQINQLYLYIIYTIGVFNKYSFSPITHCTRD